MARLSEQYTEAHGGFNNHVYVSKTKYQPRPATRSHPPKNVMHSMLTQAQSSVPHKQTQPQRFGRPIHVQRIHVQP